MCFCVMAAEEPALKQCFLPALFFFHKLYRLYRFYMPAMRFYIRFHTVLPVLHACHIKSLPSLFKFFQTSKSPQVPSSPFHVQSRFPPSPFQVASSCPLQVPSKSPQVPRSEQKPSIPKPTPTCKIEFPFYMYSPSTYFSP